MDTAPYTVLQDYRTDRLNGGGPVVWSEGDVLELGEDDASWVNRDRPGTLAGEDDVVAEPTPEPTPEPATTPVKEQVGGKPARGSSRRRDSAG